MTKKFNFTSLLLALTAMLFFLYSCSKQDSLNTNSEKQSNASAALRGSPKSTSSFGDYEIAVTVSPDGKTWTYSITAKKGAKNLSHLIIDLNNCGNESVTFANIVSATLNGLPADLKPTEGSGTGCNPQSTTSNFVKMGLSAGATSPWVFVITFDRGYEIFETASAWLKAGTSCNTGIIKAPGCPKKDYCSFSQGFFFAAGSSNNGASVSWANGLTIGGTTYTQADGTSFWAIDKGKGGDQTMNAFFQLGAIRLSGVESEMTNEVSIIDAYFTGLNVSSLITTGSDNSGTYQYINLPASNGSYTKAQVIAAGSAIGAYIAANHCE